MERLGYRDHSFPPACFTCPARIYAEGEYYCDPGRLDDGSLALDIARYRSSGCPDKAKSVKLQTSSEIILRKVLRK